MGCEGFVREALTNGDCFASTGDLWGPLCLRLLCVSGT